MNKTEEREIERLAMLIIAQLSDNLHGRQVYVNLPLELGERVWQRVNELKDRQFQQAKLQVGRSWSS